jgi:RimJ/RimL family protein N-acetyltransferase
VGTTFKIREPKIRIRPICINDAEKMVWMMKPDALKNFMFFERKVTFERQSAYLANMIASDRDELFAITWLGGMIGTCGLHEIDRHNKNARLGVMIFECQYRGKGFGAEAIRKLLALAFKKYKFHKVYLKVFAENTASCTKYAHLGFEFETRLREQYRLRGKYHDMAVMSMFARDWRKKKRGRS